MRLRIRSILAAIAALTTACTTLEHSNPYDPETQFEVIVRERHDILAHDQTIPDSFNEFNPLTVENWIQVEATLTIEPGAHLRFTTQAGLEIARTGRILARGTAEAPISFVNDMPTHTQWRGIVVTASPEPTDTIIFEHCRFEKSIFYLAGHTRFVNCRLDNCEIRNMGGATGSMRFEGCYINGGGSNFEYTSADVVYDSCSLDIHGIFLRNHSSFLVRNSLVKSCISATDANFIFSRCTFKGDGRAVGGIQAATFSLFNGCTGSISGNLFDSCEVGMYIRTTTNTDDPAYRKDNTVTISGNNFLHSAENAISLWIQGGSGEAPQSTPVDVRNNYWGTTDTSDIQALFYDAVTDTFDPGFGISTVNFVPFAPEPIADAGKNW